jgi:hypothetical protein
MLAHAAKRIESAKLRQSLFQTHRIFCRRAEEVGTKIAQMSQIQHARNRVPSRAAARTAPPAPPPRERLERGVLAASDAMQRHKTAAPAGPATD